MVVSLNWNQVVNFTVFSTLLALTGFNVRFAKPDS
jgi:hypothetical protein